jgi:hypothetical protein
LMMGGSGSGFVPVVPLNNGSGSERPKNLRNGSEPGFRSLLQSMFVSRLWMPWCKNNFSRFHYNWIRTGPYPNPCGSKRTRIRIRNSLNLFKSFLSRIFCCTRIFRVPYHVHLILLPDHHNN